MAQVVGGIVQAGANQPVTDHPQATLTWAGPAQANPGTGDKDTQANTHQGCSFQAGAVTAPFAWHLFLLRLAHRRHQDDGRHEQDAGQDSGVPADRQDEPAAATEAPAAVLAGNGQDGEPSRVLVRVLLAGERKDRPVSWQDVADRTGLSRSRAYALLREERARLAAGNGHQPTLDSADAAQ